MQPKLIKLTEEQEYEANGLPFRNKNAARWAYRHRHSNGLESAFRKIGKQVLIDVPGFHAAIAARRA